MKAERYMNMKLIYIRKLIKISMLNTTHRICYVTLLIKTTELMATLLCGHLPVKAKNLSDMFHYMDCFICHPFPFVENGFFTLLSVEFYCSVR